MLHELVLGLVGATFGGWIGAMLHWRYGAGVHDAYGKEQRRRAKERRKNLIKSHRRLDAARSRLEAHKLSGHDYDEYGLL